ncbi:MAG: hypothetical protein HOB58_09870 [Nitrospina sp.]|nr:hypothetical protein [Nitrospina sp.]
MFEFLEKKTKMILDVSVSFSRLIGTLNKEYGLIWEDFEDPLDGEEGYSANFQLIDLGDDWLISFNGRFSFFSSGDFLLARSFKVKPEKCDKIFEKNPRGEEPLASYREDSLREDMYMGYLGLDCGEIIITIKTFDEHIESDETICSFDLLKFIKMNNLGYKKSRVLDFDEREKLNAKDIYSILGDDWEVADRHTTDHPKPRFEEVVESPYLDYLFFGKPPKNDAMSISLKFQYSD